MKALKTWGIIVSIVLIAFAVIYPVPEKHMHVSGSYSAYDNSWADNEGAEYIGGDAYNYQIEASLKGGYVSGILAMKAINFVGGLLLFFYTLLASAKCAASEAQVQILNELKRGAEAQTEILNQFSEQLSKPAAESDGDDGREDTGEESIA